jgi:benzodiazapine receptor
VTELASKSQLRMAFLRVALFTVPAVLLLGTLAGRLSNSGSGNPWYRGLDLPSFQPPGWAFAVVWPILYICLGLALAMLIHARGAPKRGPLIALFLLQLAINYAWSPVFFALHQVTLGLVLTGIMITLTILLIVMLWRVRTAAALLMLPYLAWLCFAFALNYRIMVDNPGASAVAPAAGSANIPID